MKNKNSKTIEYSEAEKQWRKRNEEEMLLKKSVYDFLFKMQKEREDVFLFAVVKTKEKKEEKAKKEAVIAKLLTEKEVAALKKGTLKARAALDDVPPTPFEVIQPALSMLDTLDLRQPLTCHL